MLLAAAAFLVSWLLVAPWIPRQLGWVPFYATAAGVAWFSIGGVGAAVAGMIGAGLGATSPLIPILPLLHVMPIPVLSAFMFVGQFFGPAVLGGLGGGLLTGWAGSRHCGPPWVPRLGITGSFTAGLAGAAAGHLSWAGPLLLETVGTEPPGEAAQILLWSVLLVAAVGVAGGVAGMSRAWLARRLRRQPR